MYVLVRTDLSVAQQAVQATHAAIEATRHYLKPTDQHPHLVLIQIRSEYKLMQTAMKLEDLGIPFRVFREADRNDEATALATAPITGELRQFFEKYKLLGG